jgi:hypothetical protein
MSISIHECRLSLIWLKALSTHTPVTALEESQTYKSAFEKARDSTSNSLWSPPWKFGREQSFWEYYLYKYKDKPARVANAVIDDNKAWDYLLPMRRRVLGKVTTVTQPEWLRRCSVYIEGYHYPHAVAVVINLTVRENKGMTLGEMVDRTVGLRQQEKWFEAAWVGKEKPAPLRLPEIADGALSQLGKEVYADGKIEWQMDKHASPFTIATVIDAAGASPFTEAKDVKEDPDFYHVLDGLCGGSQDWRLEKPFGADLRLKSTVTPAPPFNPPPAGHVLRAAGAGRAIWFPRYFKEHFKGQERERPVLGSYHRRLTLLSLQVESLITLLQRSQGYFKSGKMSDDLAERTNWACRILGQLYGGKGTYKSFSAQKQIEIRADLVNTFRKGLNMRELYSK